MKGAQPGRRLRGCSPPGSHYLALHALRRDSDLLALCTGGEANHRALLLRVFKVQCKLVLRLLVQVSSEVHHLEQVARFLSDVHLLVCRGVALPSLLPLTLPSMHRPLQRAPPIMELLQVDKACRFHPRRLVPHITRESVGPVIGTHDHLVDLLIKHRVGVLQRLALQEHRSRGGLLKLRLSVVWFGQKVALVSWPSEGKSGLHSCISGFQL